MRDPQTAIDPSEQAEVPLEDDLSGRERVSWNVVFSWAGHMVHVVAGFVMPRLLDYHLGQVALGVWDFGWATIAYFGLVQAGIGSSVNRYVARYRSRGDVEGVCRAVTSVTCVLLVSAAVVVVLTLAAAWQVPARLSNQLSDYVDEARWVVVLLGASLAVQMAFGAFAGVVTGCHRWGLHNLITSGFYAVSIVAMILVLTFGGGLRSLAIAYLGGVICAELTRAVAAHRVYAGLRVRVRYASFSQARRMLMFGGKSMMNSISRVLLYSTTSLLITGCLGPAALAAYARSGALVRHAMVFLQKYAQVLTPLASSLESEGDIQEIRDLVVRSGRYAMYLTLPIMLTLSILGGPILHVWMGPAYELSLVLAILAVGHAGLMVHAPAMNILMGLNAHAWPSVANLIGAVVSVGFVYASLYVYGMGLPAVALGVAVPLTIVNGLLLPAYTCRRVGLSMAAYAWSVGAGPVLCAVPFSICLALARLTFVDRPGWAVLSGCAGGGVVLGALYWRYVAPVRIRNDVRRTVQRAIRPGRVPMP